MGMQCTFMANDRPDNVTLAKIHHTESDTYSAELQDDYGNRHTVNLSVGVDDVCWFDCGRFNEGDVKDLFEFLIMHRIPFTCA